MKSKQTDIQINGDIVNNMNAIVSQEASKVIIKIGFSNKEIARAYLELLLEHQRKWN